jgi:hypothetical protein
MLVCPIFKGKMIGLEDFGKRPTNFCLSRRGLFICVAQPILVFRQDAAHEDVPQPNTD